MAARILARIRGRIRGLFGLDEPAVALGLGDVDRDIARAETIVGALVAEQEALVSLKDATLEHIMRANGELESRLLAVRLQLSVLLAQRRCLQAGATSER